MRPLDFNSAHTAREAAAWLEETMAELDSLQFTDDELAEAARD